MKTIQVVLEEELLRAADREARRARINRSELIREALRQHLQWRRVRALEEQHRLAYARHPVEPGELDVLDAVRAWPEE